MQLSHLLLFFVIFVSFVIFAIPAVRLRPQSHSDLLMWDAPSPRGAAHNRFAHTNAFLVPFGGRRPTSVKDAGRFVAEIDALIAGVPLLSTDALRKDAADVYRRAREFFSAQPAR